MSEKYDHEDAALQTLCDELIARGSRAEITTHPDRDLKHPLTVDALISINGTEWAVDHCLLSRPQLLPTAMEAAEAALQTRLDAIAQEHRCLIFASYLPQTGVKGEKWGAAYYDRIVELAEEAATTSATMVTGDDTFSMVQTCPSDSPTAVLAPFTDTTGHPGVGTQVDAGLRAPLLKKLDGQLKQAKEAGFPTALLLDQVPRPGVSSRTVWIAGPTTVAAVVTAILQAHGETHPKVLDQVWLRPAVPALPLVSPALHLLIA
jgi:hypothetical protein